jgi:hypothetical protein
MRNGDQEMRMAELGELGIADGEMRIAEWEGPALPLGKPDRLTYRCRNTEAS